MKKSRDPLNGIQKLETLTLMSQFQKLTAKSAPNIYEYTEWKHLTPEEKREFGLAFIGKSRTDSEASD